MKALAFEVKGRYFVLSISMGHQGLDYALSETADGDHFVRDEFTDLDTEDDCLKCVADCDTLVDLGLTYRQLASLWRNAKGRI